MEAIHITLRLGHTTGIGDGARRARDLAIYAPVAAVAALSWLVVWRGEHSPYGRYLHHDASSGSSDPLAAATVFLAAWTLMVIATLLPTATPLLRAFRRVVRRRPHRARLQAALAGGFVGVWVVCGYVAYAADTAVHATVDTVPWLAERPHLISAGLLVAAGIYQFAPLKRRCLELCRSPRGVLFRNWGGSGSAARQARAVGTSYGLSCLGCCWPLMLLMFAFGLGSLTWMVVLAAVMAIEKNAPIGPRLTRPLGVVLLVAGSVVAVTG